MKVSSAFVRARALDFLRENTITCVIYLFLFICGMVAGIQLAGQYGAWIDMRSLTGILHAGGAPFLYCAFMALCTILLIVTLTLLPGLLFWTAPLWPIPTLLKGILTGAQLMMIQSLWPDSLALWLMVALLLNVAVFLPVHLQMAAISKAQLSDRLKQFFGVQEKRNLHNEVFLRYLRLSKALFPCLFFEGMVVPLLVYLFG